MNLQALRLPVTSNWRHKAPKAIRRNSLRKRISEMSQRMNLIWQKRKVIAKGALAE